MRFQPSSPAEIVPRGHIILARAHNVGKTLFGAPIRNDPVDVGISVLHVDVPILTIQFGLRYLEIFRNGSQGSWQCFFGSLTLNSQPKARVFIYLVIALVT